MKPGKTTIVDIVDMEPAEQLSDLAQALADLRSQIDKTAGALSAAFSGSAAAQTVNMTKYIEKFSGQLLYLRLNFGRLKAAIFDAAAPLGAVLLPVLNSAIYAASRLANAIGGVLGALMDNIFGTDAAAQSAQKAATAQKTLASSAKAARRSLAGFDQLERLNGSTGSVSAALPESAQEPELFTLTPKLQAVVDKILSLLQPLRTLDFVPLGKALETLRSRFQTVWTQIGNLLEWTWHNLLVPLFAWAVEELAPVLADTLSQTLSTLSTVLAPVLTGLKTLWEELQPLVPYIGQAVIGALQLLSLRIRDLGTLFAENGPQIVAILQNIGSAIASIWDVAGPVLTVLAQQFAQTFLQLRQAADRLTVSLTDRLLGITEFLAGRFTWDWERAWDGLKLFVKGTVNGMVAILNRMLSAVTGAFNGVVKAANSLSFRVPDWVPVLGGQSFGLNLKTVKTPQIPYLAQGAVLPANRPFLAMVGDQTHGTNIEAPLATIQQAVAQVTAQQSQAVMAAIEQSVGVQKEILSAVLGIHIGDSVIAQAVDRYRSRQAVIHGTPY